MREIEFDHKIYHTTIETIDAIAWATMRRGRTAWKSNNVVQQIRDYLLDHGAHPDDYPRSRISAVLNKLNDYKFGRLTAAGKRYIGFEFFSDVELRRDTPSFAQVKAMANPTDVEIEDDVVLVTDDVGLPLPDVKPARWMADEINEALDRFAEAKPEAYAAYAERLLIGLKNVVQSR